MIKRKKYIIHAKFKEDNRIIYDNFFPVYAYTRFTAMHKFKKVINTMLDYTNKDNERNVEVVIDKGAMEVKGCE